MSREELEAWAVQYPAIAQFTKNPENRRHALMIPWEELPAMDAYEKRVTGKPVDYQRMDTDNMLAIGKLLGEGCG